MRLWKRKKQKPITYKFKAKDNTDYEIIFDMYSSNELFEKMLKLAKFQFKKRLMKEQKKKLKDIDLTEVKQFEIDVRFYTFIHNVALNKSIKDVENQLKEDKIELISSHVEKGFFIRQPDEWLIKIHVGGQYADKRFR